MEKETAETTSIRLRTVAVEEAKIAASFKKLSVVDYASAILLETAQRDIEQAQRERSQVKPSKAKR